MAERDDHPVDRDSTETPRERVGRNFEEGADPAEIGALDGAAAAGAAGAVGRPDSGGSLMPEEGPDPSVGPD